MQLISIKSKQYPKERDSNACPGGYGMVESNIVQLWGPLNWVATASETAEAPEHGRHGLGGAELHVVHRVRASGVREDVLHGEGLVDANQPEDWLNPRAQLIRIWTRLDILEA